MRLRRSEDRPARRRRRGEAPTRAGERLEARELLATMAPVSATVKADGRVVELVFSAPMPAAYGVPDYLPGQLAGVSAELSNGTPLENIGNVVTTTPASGSTPARLVWTADYLIDNPAQVVTFGQGQTPLVPNGTRLSVVAGGGLLQDTSGNSTAAVDVPVVNDSLVDANGFTTRSFQRGTGGVTVYVSSTHGNDNETLAQAENVQTPFRTLAQALNALFNAGQNGKGAAVELLRGDVFQAGVKLRTGGQDAAHPFVMESYWYNYSGTGTDPGTRPVIQYDESQPNAGLAVLGAPPPSTPTPINYVVLRDLDFEAVNWYGQYNGRNGLEFLMPGSTGLTLDDDVVGNFGNNVVIQGTDAARMSDVSLIRCIVVDSRAITSSSQGLFVYDTDNLLISQSTFDDNGRVSADRTGRNMYAHNIYIQYNCGPSIVWGNSITNGGSHGVQMRGGGVLAYNYFAGNAIAAFVAGVGGSQYKNVVEYGQDISPTLPRGFGLQMFGGNAQSIDDNIIVNSQGHQPRSIDVGVPTWQNTGVHAGRIRGNTVANGGTFTIDGGTHGSIISSNNILDTGGAWLFNSPTYPSWAWYSSDNNVLSTSLPLRSAAVLGGQGPLAYWKAATGGTEAHSLMIQPTFANPTADGGGYLASTGGAATQAAFIAALRGRGLDSWGSLFDPLNIYKYFAAAFTPTNLPSVATTTTTPARPASLSYFGAVPYDLGTVHIASGTPNPIVTPPAIPSPKPPAPPTPPAQSKPPTPPAQSKPGGSDSAA